MHAECKMYHYMAYEYYSHHLLGMMRPSCRHP